MRVTCRDVMVFAVLISAACGPIRSTSTPLDVEQSAPAFTLTDQNGQEITLESLLSNGPAVLVFNRGHR